MNFFPKLQKNLLLESINFVPEGPLIIVVSYVVSKEPPMSPIGRDGWDVMSYPEEAAISEKYSIHFDSVISYTIGNEMIVQADNQGEFNGAQFRRYKRSRYLQFIEDSSNGMIGLPPEGGAHYHYGIYCTNQLIEVITLNAPRIAFMGNSGV